MQLIWLDLETTGLHPQQDAVLEIAASVADFARPFDAAPLFHAVIGCTDDAVVALLRDNPYVHGMHTKSGLLAECLRSSTRIEDAEASLLALVPEIADREEMPVLAGSTVHFDHGFVKRWMPALDKRFSHRHYDVSAVKLFCCSLGMTKPPKAEAHRARDDVRESIAHGKLCADWLAYEYPARAAP
jgi:oligoribonuclease